MTLNRSPGFCLKLTYRYLLKANHATGDICRLDLDELCTCKQCLDNVKMCKYANFDQHITLSSRVMSIFNI